MNPKYEALFTPFKIGEVEIPNRIVQCSMGGTTLFGWLEPSHFDEEAANFLLQRAKDGDPVDIWIPDLLQPVEEIPEYSYGVFAAENNAASISLNHLDFDPEQTLEDIEKLVPDWGAESDGIFVVNDTYALVYETKEEDSLSILILLGEGNALEVVVTPISNKDVYSIASLVMASIRPTEPTMKDIGVMMDADIKSFWGDSRDVRMADDENGRSISIFMWEDGITSETVKDINNWDEVRAAKINLYNAYVDVLEEFDMNDILLRLSYISADQDVAFFSIEGGQITYDVFEDAAA